jgi:hypothetical protein
MIVLAVDPGGYTGGAVLMQSEDLRTWEVIDAIGLRTRSRKRGRMLKEGPVDYTCIVAEAEVSERYGNARLSAREILAPWVQAACVTHNVDVGVCERIRYQGGGAGKGAHGSGLVDLVACSERIAGIMHSRCGSLYTPYWQEWVKASMGKSRGVTSKEATAWCVDNLPRLGIDLGELSTHPHAVEAAAMGRVGALRRGRR